MEQAVQKTQAKESLAQRIKKNGISGSTIKIIAMAAMLIDHIGAFILEKIIGINEMIDMEEGTEEYLRWMVKNYNLILFDNILRLIGRIAFPIFCFLLVEGFFYTRSKQKYALRLLFFGILSEIPFDLAGYDTIFYSDYQNVYFTLLLGFLAMWSLDFINKVDFKGVFWNILSKLSFFIFGGFVWYILQGSILSVVLDFLWPVRSREVWIIGFYLQLPNLANLIVYLCFGLISLVVLCILTRKFEKKDVTSFAIGLLPVYVIAYLGDVLHTDYGLVGVLTVVILYIFKKNKPQSMLWACGFLSFCNPMEITAFADFGLLKIYNGKRGLKLKYVFYAFYPVHLLLLYFIGKCFI